MPYFFSTQNPQEPVQTTWKIHSGITYGLSQYIDTFLQPIVQELPLYIQDSSYLLGTLANYTWKSTYSWLSLDVSSLFTSIPHPKIS